MRTQSIEERNKPSPTASGRHSWIFSIFLSLTFFSLGGYVSFLIVNDLLKNLLDIYGDGQHWEAASAILDFIDKLVPFYFIYGGISLGLVLVTVSVKGWMMMQTRRLGDRVK